MSNLRQTQLTPKIVFCNPNGIGVRRANSTTLKARGPDMTLNIARPVSVFINLKIEMRKFFENFRTRECLDYYEMEFPS